VKTVRGGKAVALRAYLLSGIDGGLGDWLQRMQAGPAAPRGRAVPVFNSPNLAPESAVVGLAWLTWAPCDPTGARRSVTTWLFTLRRESARLPALRERAAELAAECNAGAWRFEEAGRELFDAASEAGAVRFQRTRQGGGRRQ